MLLSNLSSHPSLLPLIARLAVPIVPLPLAPPLPAPAGEDGAAAANATVEQPKWYLPAGLSGSSTVHREYRDPSLVPPNKAAGQEDERPIEAVRALVQAFEDGAGRGVKEGKGGRKGECHFLASVFANLSTVSEGGAGVAGVASGVGLWGSRCGSLGRLEARRESKAGDPQCWIGRRCRVAIGGRLDIAAGVESGVARGERQVARRRTARMDIGQTHDVAKVGQSSCNALWTTLRAVAGCWRTFDLRCPRLPQIF